MEEQMIRISKKQLKGMQETIEILQNPDLMSQILESEENINNKKINKLEI